MSSPQPPKPDQFTNIAVRFSTGASRIALRPFSTFATVSFNCPCYLDAPANVPSASASPQSASASTGPQGASTNASPREPQVLMVSQNNFEATCPRCHNTYGIELTFYNKKFHHDGLSDWQR